MQLILPTLLFVSATFRAISLCLGVRHWTPWPMIEDTVTVVAAFGSLMIVPFVVMV